MKLTYAFVVIALILFIYSYLGAITFPPSLSQHSGVDRFFTESLLLLVTALLLTLIGRAIGIGVVIMGVKNPLEAGLLAYVGAFVLGGILALLSLLNVPFCAHVNLLWLGGSWYDPWVTMAILGAPIMLAFLA